MSLDNFKCSTRETKGFVTEILQAGLVPYIKSSPGMGKSSIVKEIGDEYGLEIIDMRLSTKSPVDISGLPTFVNGVSKFVPFDTFPTQETPLPKGKEGWIIFFDEFNSGLRSTLAAAYQPILDKMVGNVKLHEKVMIVAAGNLDTDKAITNTIGTALQSRFITLEMFLKKDSMNMHTEFMEDVAFKYDWDQRVISYLSMNPDSLMDFRPDHNDKTFCCPRTWDFMQRLIKGKDFSYRTVGADQVYDMEAKMPLYAGTITSGEALSFVNFTKVFTNLPKLPDILRDPQTANYPSDNPTKYATTTMLMSLVTDDTFDKIAEYMNRFPAEMRVLFYRGLLIKKQNLRSHPAFRKAIAELSRYLND